ncbi:mitochondrial inner membrane protein OXA1-like isoform X2 [Olea europaea var. sylvestris]|uniref:Mitochondrial inner membrane OXA1-like n=1 Tax=Olea europaea subsp. europaea TaxID=158383 RepID=A0A8S0SX43_OLEEU|nr:mitochondrial inner membrane protein OXA1-like isoform X2 [Olea europaea var. sylvestris]CAA2996829.1 mitochondrial inner membrane OXA1-like [Olea europaea subsp. europaea]
MAYRRRLTARANHLYQQRFGPSFSCIHRDDNDCKNPSNNPIWENPKIPNFFQQGFLGTRNSSFCRVNGSKSLFRDYRFSIPVSYGPVFARYMSAASVGEGAADKIEIVNDVVEVLADKTAEAGAVVNEVAIAAADSYFPVAALQYLIDYVHSITGFNWWASIIATTLVIRWLALPLMVNQLKATSKFTLLRPQLEEIKEDMQNRGMTPTAVAEGQAQMQALFKEYGVTPFTPLKGLLIQGPVFVSFFLAISNMVEKVPSFKHGGAFWFTDLTTPDSMYIFPVLTALTFWITVECNAQEGLEGNPSAGTIKNVSRGFAALSIPFTAGFPKAVFCYWITSNFFSLVYGLIIRNQSVKNFLGVPIIPVQPPSKNQKPALPFFEMLKKFAAAQQQPLPLPIEASKSTTQKMPSSLVLNQRLKSIEKEVKGRKKGKKSLKR